LSFADPKLPAKLLLARITFGRYIGGGWYEMGAEFFGVRGGHAGREAGGTNWVGRLPNHWVSGRRRWKTAHPAAAVAARGFGKVTPDDARMIPAEARERSPEARRRPPEARLTRGARRSWGVGFPHDGMMDYSREGFSAGKPAAIYVGGYIRWGRGLRNRF